MTRIVICGAGIGGLTAALALARKGVQVTVFERTPAFGEVGGGLQIGPNGARVLSALGLDAALDAVAQASDGVELIDGIGGRRLALLPVGRQQAPHRTIARAALVTLLAEAAQGAGAEIQLGQIVTEFGPGPEVTLAGGGRRAGDLVIGACGIHSPLRRQMDRGATTPFFTGQVAWRATFAAEVPQRTTAWLLPGRHVVSYPLGGGLTNLVATREQAEWAPDGWHHPDAPEALQAVFADAAAELRALLAKVEAVHLWGLFRTPVARRWWAPGQVLLGDAAHATLPFMAQGANMAIEDAWVLSEMVARHGASDAVLQAYQAARAPRCGAVVEKADHNGRLYHMRGAPRTISHAVMRAGGPLFAAWMRRRLAWIHDADVTAPEW